MNRLARKRAPLPQFRPLTLVLAVSAALASLSAQAGVTIAQQPLLIAEPVAPNIMLILDDTGSMRDATMCATNVSCSATGVNSAYTRNGLGYNPAITYKPWANADGSLMPNANRTAVNDNPESLTLLAATEVPRNLWSGFRDFYVPQNIDTGDTGNASLFRWVLGNDTGTAAGTTAKAWKCPGTSTGNPPQTGVNTSNCTPVTSSLSWTLPDGSTITRSIEDEWQNYANWWHYYRGRAKMAKAAVSHAFAALDEGFRVGFKALNDGRTGYGTGTGANNLPMLRIPVGTDNGLFRGTNRQSFYDKLFATGSNSGTPTRKVLDKIGEYYMEQGNNGPWGPESGNAQISCRQNFAILTTDGGWNETFDGKHIGDADGTAGPTHTDPKGVKTYTYTPEWPYRDKEAPNTVTSVVTLADVAMHYWKNDLRPDMPNNVPTTAKNPAFWQHMRTFTISIGQFGKVPPQGPYPLNWGTPSASGNDSPEKTDDLLHAAVNSRGEFVAATNPDEFAKGLVDALTAIASETKSEASGSANSMEVKSGANTYFSLYTSGTWHGDIVAFPVDHTTGQQQTTPAWQAESQLPAWNSRNIQVNVNGSAKPFLYSNLNAAQKHYLSADLVDYLRGDRSKEADKPNGTLRQRAGVLPAFINSQLVYVAGPEHGSYYGKLSFTGASAYAAYADTKKDRKPVIYIAGNNGMLHAFDAGSGKEIYAFLPNFSISEKLTNYADKSYGNNKVTAKPHQYILDGELTVADAYISDPNGGAPSWKTILIATQGRGGSGIFALDVTDPDHIEFLWEKSAADYNALGNNLGKPVIVQVASQDWRVILGNGPNSVGDKAQLLLFDLKTGEMIAVDTGEGINNGLAAVNPWDGNKDGFFESAYAGDLRGNVWRFKDLATSPTAEKLLAGDPSRPITAMPLVLRNLKTGATWVYVGTGQYLNMDDLKNTDTQTWYGLIDNGPTIASLGQLQQRKLIGSGGAGRVLEAGTEWDIIGGTNPKRGWYINFDLPPHSGERMMTPNFVRGGVLLGITFTPDASDPCQPDGKSSLWAVNPFSGGRLNQGIFDSNGDGTPDKVNVGGGLYFLSVLDGLSAITSGAPPVMFNPGGSGGVVDGGGGTVCPPSDSSCTAPKKKPPQYCVYPYGETFCFNAPAGGIGRQSWREIIGQ